MKRHWARLGMQIVRSRLGRDRTSEWISHSYDRIAGGYDDAWTNHMRDLSASMLDRLDLPKGATCLDLTCGTGYLTTELDRRTGGRVIGVDASAGMIRTARERHGHACEYVQADIVDYLRALPPKSFDVITCGWGLGYSRPLSVIRHAARVLRPGGELGVIDNSLFSLAEVLWTSILTFAEMPEALTQVMRVRFLPNSATLAAIMRLNGLAIRHQEDGKRTYTVPDGSSAITRLTATGAAAGFEFAAMEAGRDALFQRFAEILENRYKTNEGVPITHRYLMTTGKHIERRNGRNEA